MALNVNAKGVHCLPKGPVLAELEEGLCCHSNLEAQFNPSMLSDCWNWRRIVGVIQPETRLVQDLNFNFPDLSNALKTSLRQEMKLDQSTFVPDEIHPCLALGPGQHGNLLLRFLSRHTVGNPNLDACCRQQLHATTLPLRIEVPCAMWTRPV